MLAGIRDHLLIADLAGILRKLVSNSKWRKPIIKLLLFCNYEEILVDCIQNTIYSNNIEAKL